MNRDCNTCSNYFNNWTEEETKKMDDYYEDELPYCMLGNTIKLNSSCLDYSSITNRVTTTEPLRFS